ncbi:SDR family NAD(P)-dependent oxidoreductase [Promicromonospora sukumoe]|uniref:SDR family NAD(P)-dependent oxidoreductase n=1 Tax=Promicromonospora sukumoe TaxID=88382 RepID=UPI0036592344
MALTPRSTVGDWLDHPVGGPILTAFLAQGGATPDSLAPARGLALEQLVAMSGGKFPAEALDALVAAYREAAPEEAAAGDAAAAAGETPGGETAGGESATAGWAEQITPGRFAGQTVVVTGAASGIGRAVASRVAREGGRVIAADISAERLDELAAGLTRLPSGAQLIPVAGDISRQDDVERIAAAAGDRVDALANVAGIMDDMSAIHEVSDALWERVLRVNLGGTMRLTRAVVPGMLAAKEGRIVNVASEAGLRGSAAGVAYTASKHAVVGLTKSSAVMYAKHGIRTNAVAPGGVATGIPVPGQAEFGAPVLRPHQVNILSLAMAEELAATITFLLSKDSVNLNGAIIAADGGWSAV